MTQAADDLDLLDETVEVERPRRVVAPSIASFAVLVVIAVGAGIALVTAVVLYGLPAIQTIAEFVNSR